MLTAVPSRLFAPVISIELTFHLQALQESKLESAVELYSTMKLLPKKEQVQAQNWISGFLHEDGANQLFSLGQDNSGVINENFIHRGTLQVLTSHALDC